VISDGRDALAAVTVVGLPATARHVATCSDPRLVWTTSAYFGSAPEL
jgi:hypothetical protein